MAETQGQFGFADLKSKSARLGHFQDAARDRQRRRRARDRDIKLAPIVDPARRGRCKNRPQIFANTYFPDLFYNPFTPDQRTMFKVIKDRLIYGGLQALAAARGDGKTTIIEVATLWAIAYGHIRYAVILGPNAGHAKNILEDLKDLMEFSDLFAQDFPEISTPIRALEGRPQNANFQTVNGTRTRIVWSKEMVRLPDIEGSPSRGAMVVTRGVESSIRGLVQRGIRPDLVLIDDLETTQSAGSQAEINSRRDVVNQDVLGLAGPGKTLRAAYLCTIAKRGCLADELTDRNRSPAWHGIRQKFLISKPDRSDLWDKYQEIRDAERIRDPESKCRESHAFYTKHKTQMNKGAKVNNPHRFDGDELDDGTQKEISAIQHAMNRLYDMGDDAFNSEFQNDPPDVAGTETGGATVSSVCQKINHLERGVVPPWADKLTAGIDVGSAVLHWVILAWRNPAISSVVDYGTEQVHRPRERIETPGQRKQLQDAIFSALSAWYERIATPPGYSRPGGGSVPLASVLVDSGWMPDAIYQFCRGRREFLPSKGFGSLTGQTRYKAPTAKVQQGPSWYISRPGNKTVQLINFDADHYKNEVHSGFMTTAGQPGSIELFGSEPVHHKTFGQHIAAETWTRSFVPGKGFDARFVLNSRANHYLDAMALARVAGSIAGFRILADKPGPTPGGSPGRSRGPREKVRLSDRNKRK
tara:strand:+ start:901 stop:2997 length:2097 start_codon:yes stop_codon:yes gene_type:complete